MMSDDAPEWEHADIPPPPPRLDQLRDRRNQFTAPRNQAERDAWAAARWSINGWTFPEIGAALEVSKSNAYQCVQRGLRVTQQIAQATAEQARANHRARLEYATEIAMAVLERDHIHVSHGQVVKGTDGNPILDDGPKLTAAGKVRELSESLRKLDGLDAPAKVEHTGGVTYEIVGVDPKDLR